jgi:hypothetical protein
MEEEKGCYCWMEDSWAEEEVLFHYSLANPSGQVRFATKSLAYGIQRSLYAG